jgi:hypothetical protein
MAKVRFPNFITKVKDKKEETAHPKEDREGCG